jgi:hypothetical protein
MPCKSVDVPHQKGIALKEFSNKVVESLIANPDLENKIAD